MTQFDIAPHIEKLLYEHNTVTIPDLGSFIASPAPASVDYAGGSVAPPSKVLTFNENLTADDGLLIHQIAETHQIETDEARRLVDDFVAKMQTQLDAREIVALAGIGRLYKNYVQKIQFLPDAVNFSRENFGLPPLQFSPIVRSREVAEPGQAVTATASTPVTPSPASSAQQDTIPPPYYTNDSGTGGSNFSFGRILLILALLACSAAIGYYVWTKKAISDDQDSPIEEVLDNTATPPVAANEPPAPAEQPKKEPVAAPKPVTEVKTPVEKPAHTTQPTPAAGSKECILVIGIFKDESNIASLSKIIQSKGMEVYRSAGKSGQTVGAKFSYNNLAEVQQNIAVLQKATGVQNIWIKKK